MNNYIMTFNFRGPRPRVFPRRTYISNAYMNNIQVDLIDMTKEKAGYILNGIDVFSRKAESVKLNSKTTDSIRKGLDVLFKKFGQLPKSIQSDKEGGLYALQNELKQKGITLYSVKNSYDGGYSAPIVERFNRTMREYMNKERDKRKWINKNALVNHVVKEFPFQYNYNVHSTLKARPDEVAEGFISNEKIRSDMIQRAQEPKDLTKQQYKVGEKVYVVIPQKSKIEKKDIDKWYRTPYEIEEVFQTNPITYSVVGKSEKYYKQQLRKIK